MADSIWPEGNGRGCATTLGCITEINNKAARSRKHWRAAHPQMLLVRGHDHAYLLDGSGGEFDGLRLAARAADPNSGRCLELFTELDFDVTVPDNIALRVEDGSGDLTIDNVASVDLTDGSGDIVIRNVIGDLSVRDGSGDMNIDNVSGNVHISDGSGDIDVNGAGSVEISNDGSGGVDIRNVQHDVHIGNKGSGSIEVSDVGGNFHVGNKGGGSIDWHRVAGRVDVPARFRR